MNHDEKAPSRLADNTASTGGKNDASAAKEGGEHQTLSSPSSPEPNRISNAKKSSKEGGAKKAAASCSNNVRALREERMLTVAELARRAGLSELTIRRVEKGFGCRMGTKRKILEALGLTLADRAKVFGEEG